MRYRQPFSEETNDRRQIFPGIASLDLTIRQDTSGYYLQHDWQREQRFTKANIPIHFACANSRCQQGGLNLQRIVLFSEPGEFSLSCQGQEGSPKGRRPGNPCDNQFNITLSITYTDGRTCP